MSAYSSSGIDTLEAQRERTLAYVRHRRVPCFSHEGTPRMLTPVSDARSGRRLVGPPEQLLLPRWWGSWPKTPSPCPATRMSRFCAGLAGVIYLLSGVAFAIFTVAPIGGSAFADGLFAASILGGAAALACLLLSLAAWAWRLALPSRTVRVGARRSSIWGPGTRPRGRQRRKLDIQ